MGNKLMEKEWEKYLKFRRTTHHDLMTTLYSNTLAKPNGVQMSQ